MIVVTGLLKICLERKMDLLKELHMQSCHKVLILILSIIVLFTVGCTEKEERVVRIFFSSNPNSTDFMIDLYDNGRITTCKGGIKQFDFSSSKLSNFFSIEKQQSKKISKDKMEEIYSLIDDINLDGDIGQSVTDWWMVNLQVGDYNADYSFGFSSVPEYDEVITLLLKNSSIPISDNEGNALLDSLEWIDEVKSK